MVLVDTSVWIDYYTRKPSPQAAWLDAWVGRADIGLIDLSLAEFLQGVREESRASIYLRSLREFDILDTGGQELAIASAKNYRSLRRRGITIRSTIDCFTATYCISRGHSLLHTDRNFGAFEEHLGLQVIHP